MADHGAKPGRPEKHGHGETIIKRKGPKHHDEAHGGAWKVAFADFCLALLCLFLVLWLMAAREQDKMQEIMRAPGGNVLDEGAGHMTESLGSPRGSMIDSLPMPRFGDAPVGATRAAQAGPGASAAGQVPTDVKTQYESRSELQALSDLLSKMSQDAGLANNLHTVITAYGLRVMLHDTDKQGMFERGSAIPSVAFAGLMRQMGPLFAHMSNQMLIVGHTDSMQYANHGFGAFSNWALSSNRAMSARSNLLAGGMPTNSVLQVVGMADRAPLDTADAKAAMNRRIELLILTSGQARVVSAMFGMPGKVLPLGDGVDSTPPDSVGLQSLREQMLSKSPAGPPDAN